MSCYSRCLLTFALAGSAVIGSASADEVGEHLAAGEFAAAINAVGPAQGQNRDAVQGQNRDAVLAQIASAQSASGETVAAGTTLQGIQSPTARDGVIAENGKGQGGGSFADFQSLMDLVQTTVVPDTWEALGGPSTMAPYPQGVYVDAAGTVHECESFASNDAVNDLKSLLARSDTENPAEQPLAWRLPSKMRCVSLGRLAKQWSRWELAGLAPSDAMMQMAGISRVQYLFIEDGDLIIAGPVGGIDSADGWYRDRKSGLSTLRFDFFRTCLRSALENQPFGCTIDPSREGLQRAAAIGADVQNDRIPIGKAAEAMSEALGMQRVEVFGTAGDTSIGYIMVEADRHMKQLALGVHPMPRGANNYLDVIDASIEKGPPSELLLRLWFTASQQAVRADSDETVFELAGTPIRLSGQNERAMASGQRGNITRDFRTEAFVASFNDNWTAIRSQYPVYGALESIYQSAAVSELIRRYAGESPAMKTAKILAGHASQNDYVMPTPRQIKSIATMHTVRHGRKRHHILLASGGVSIDSSQTLVSNVKRYPSLQSVEKPSESQPRVIQRWWWDSKD